MKPPLSDSRRRLARSRALLTVYLVRHVLGIVVIAAFVAQGFAMPDHRLGFYLLPALLVYAGFVAWTARKFWRQVRLCQERVRQEEGS